MNVMVICKFYEDQIKCKQAIDRKTLILVFKRDVNDPIGPIFEPIWDFIHVLVISKFDEEQMKINKL